MENLFDWNMLTRVPFQDEVQGPVWIGFLIFFAAGFFIPAGLYLRPPAAIKNHEVKRGATLKYSNWFMWAFGAALVFFAFQVMGSAVHRHPAVALDHHGRDSGGRHPDDHLFRARLSRRVAAYEERQTKRAYLRQSRQRPVGDDGRPQPRSSRAEKRRQRAGGAGARGR